MPLRPTLPWCKATSSAGKRPVWKRSAYVGAGLLAMGVAYAAVGLLLAAELPHYSVEDRRSGYTYLSEENQRLQDDDFANPGLLWVERGRDLWQQTDGAIGTSCERCHGAAAASMRGVRPRYPRFEAQRGKLINLEQQINHCRAERMHAPSYPYESEALLALTTFVAFQSRGLPIEVRIDGPAQPFFEAGRGVVYTTPRPAQPRLYPLPRSLRRPAAAW
jgi:L-cysteine S-thiosulfotransferase